MLQRLVEKLQQLSRSPVLVNPDKFNDPLALKVEWTPSKSGGSNFRTHGLEEISVNRMAFKASLGAVVFSSIFLAVGLGVFVALGYKLFQYGFESQEFDLFMPIFGGIFFTVGIIMLYQFAKPAVFDTMYGYYWKGRNKVDFGIGNSKPELFISLSQIHALQLIAEHVRSNKSSYYSYELNLVLRDGSRKNVVDHGNITRLREDADKLSKFLGKPVWDGVMNK